MNRLALLLIVAPIVLGASRVRESSGARPRGRETWTPAAFEAFRADGRGTSGACPKPNWFVYSEQIDNAVTVKESGGGASVPTVTADQALDRVGALTAERVQIPSTTAAQFSGLRQTPSIGTVPATLSADVQGNGTSGVLDFCMSLAIGGGYTCSPCSYVASGPTTCSVTATGFGGFAYIGNMSSVNGGTARSAHDIFISRVALNAGSTRAYTLTTSAAAAPTFTAATGQTFTSGRASTAICLGGGDVYRTSGVLPGDAVLYPAGYTRLVYDSVSGANGPQTETTAKTNSLLRSEELDDPIWSTAAVGVSAVPVITKDAAAGPDGATTAERVQIDSCGTSGSYSVVYQNVSASAPLGDFWVKGNGMSGSFTIYVRDATTAASSVCNFVADSYSYCKVGPLSTTTTQFGFGCLNNVSPIGGTNTGAVDVFVTWAGLGGQWSSSYVRTGSGTATRAADSLAVTPPLTTGSDFCVSENFRSPSTTNACAGLFAVTSSAGPTLYTCFNTAFVARVSSGGFNADSPNNTIGPYAWQAGVRWGVVWDRAASKAAGSINGSVGTFGVANASVTSTAWGALSLGGDGVHTKLLADQSQTRCR